MSKEKPNFNRSVFWYANYDKIDWEKNADGLICQVLANGLWEDWIELKRYYGFDRIKEAALEARDLDEMTLNLCSKFFNVPIEEFRCFNMPESIQRLWPF